MDFDVILSTGAVVKPETVDGADLAYIEGRFFTDDEEEEYYELYAAWDRSPACVDSFESLMAWLHETGNKMTNTEKGNKRKRGTK